MAEDDDGNGGGSFCRTIVVDADVSMHGDGDDDNDNDDDNDVDDFVNVVFIYQQRICFCNVLYFARENFRIANAFGRSVSI